MNLIRAAILYPVTTAVAVMLLVLFGAIALFNIPVQLTPTVERPEVSVVTRWPGASPQEIEREIVEEQEEQLKSLEGLVEMESSSSDSEGEITLTFATGTDIDTAILLVSNKLQQVEQYPDDADRPVIRTVGAERNAITWMVMTAYGDEPYDGDISHLFDFVDEFVKPEFERVSGVAAVNVFGGREREMRVVVDPAKLAAQRLTMNELGRALERENRNYSAGDFWEGKRRYIVRTVGEYTSPEEIEEVVIAVREGTPIRVGDVARAELGYQKPRSKTFFKDERMIAMNAQKEAGANVLEVMEGIRATLDDVNVDLLAPRGLQLRQVYDQTDYIDSAIELVLQSLVLGGLLAVVVLLIFLRSWTTTLIVALAIPISAVGAILMLAAFGRSVNVVSLAGMAFAVGMVVDNSIVVLENIYRHRQLGKSRTKAAFEGAREVWGAVLASTVTTVAVFVPVLFVQEEAGQLFRDIAIAISCAVALSLIVSMTVIPSLSNRLLDVAPAGTEKRGWRDLWGLAEGAKQAVVRVSHFVAWICRSTTRRLVVVAGFTTAALIGSWLLMPKAEYLPTGNQNLIFGILQPPPGYNIDRIGALHEELAEKLGPMWRTPEEEAGDLPGGGVRSFFYVATPASAFMGARANDPARVRELVGPFNRAVGQLPGVIGFVTQRSLFSQGFGEGRNIDVDITGPELETLVGLGARIFGQVREVVPGAQARPIPSLDLGNPEVRVVTHRRRAAELGISNRDLGFVVNALVDGARASEYRYDGQEIDLVVIGESSDEIRSHLLDQLPIATPMGDLVTLGTVASVEVTSGPAQINHRERERTVTIAVTPPEDVPLQEAMEAIESSILEPLREEGEIGGLYRVRLSGTADKLTQTGRALIWNLVLALIITYLVMSALFESFAHPFVIMFSVPLAALGGFLGLAAMNLVSFQSMDILTMLGFIILIGTVVNNAILIVHQSLNHMRNGQTDPVEAIRRSVEIRVRPIFMSVLTSVCGMLPLVLFPGAGSELYRGLGSVVVGGLLVSTVFTLFLVPALFSLMLDLREKIGWSSWRDRAEAPPTFVLR